MSDSGGGTYGEDSRDGITDEPIGAKGGDSSPPADQNDPPDPPNRNLPPKSGSEGSRQNGGPGSGQQDNEPSRFDGQLKLTDFFIALFGGLSFFAAAISAGVAIWTAGQLREASNQTDNAIGRIAAVANATEDEANSVGNEVGAIRDQDNTMVGEFGEMQNQTGLLSNQVGEVKKQTRAISDQTTAIKNSSAAAVKAYGAELETAKAQTRSADITERAQMPIPALTRLEINGVGGIEEKGMGVIITMLIEFNNNGGGAFIQKSSTLNLYVANSLPDKRSGKDQLQWGGNDFNVAPGKGLQPTVPFKWSISKSTADLLKEGKVFAFVYGALNYQDTLFRDHSFCFAYRLTVRDGELRDPFPVGGASYHCQT